LFEEKFCEKRERQGKGKKERKKERKKRWEKGSIYTHIMMYWWTNN
jgi:hypothetical protein